MHSLSEPLELVSGGVFGILRRNGGGVQRVVAEVLRRDHLPAFENTGLVGVPRIVTDSLGPVSKNQFEISLIDEEPISDADTIQIHGFH